MGAETQSIALSIAGITVRLEGVRAALAPVLERRYAAFESGADAGAVWELDMAAPPEAAWPGDAPHVIVEHTADGAVRYAMADLDARWDPAAGRGRARLAATEYAVDGLLRVWLSGELLRGPARGGLFHAAGAAREGRGWLFAGRSGAGKSTLAAACAPHELLSDELTAVRRGADGSFEVWGTPFMGELGVGGRNISAPLDRFYLLDRHAPPGLTPAPRASAAAELWSTLLCFDTRPDTAAAALDLCNAMARDLPCQRLCFDKNAGPWRLLHDQ